MNFRQPPTDIMAKVRTDQPILPSLLDRLIDDDPKKTLEVVKPAITLLNEVKAGIRRDLENLLNTRLFRQASIEKYDQLDNSILNYGLRDFSTLQFSSEEHRERFKDEIISTIERYESRFHWVKVEIDQLGEDHDRTLYLKINALLNVEPDPIPLLFDSRIQALDRAVKLRELRHG